MFERVEVKNHKSHYLFVRKSHVLLIIPKCVLMIGKFVMKTNTALYSANVQMKAYMFMYIFWANYVHRKTGLTIIL